MHEYQIIMSS
jgi:hypothetical protein